MDGSRRYHLRFASGQLPPAGAFWSLAAYDAQGLLAPNALNRQALGSRDPLRYNEDGSLDLVLGHEAPAPEQQSNWLPLPASGPAQLLLRVYQPGPALLDGLWTPPLLLLEAPSEATAEVAPPPPSPATDADPTAAPSAAAAAAPIARPGRHGVLARQACGPGQGQAAAPAAPLTGAATRAPGGIPRPPARARPPPHPPKKRQRRARASRYHIHFSNQERPTWTTPSATNCR